MRLWFLLAVLVCTGTALAHEMRPAYLDVVEESSGNYAVVWKVPSQGEMSLSMTPVFPAGCEQIRPARVVQSGGSVVQHLSVSCPSSLIGASILIDGLSATMTDVIVRFEHADGVQQTVLLKPSDPSFTVSESPTWRDVAASYMGLGVEHILFGIDHLLFVFALLLLVRGGWLLVKTITAFTIAHSITLAAATLDLVQVPQAPVEAVIALSILFLAVELAKRHEGKPGLTETYPWIVAFTFGLLHGFGFAGALGDIGLPQDEIPLALLFFNVGVEAGQLAFIGGVVLLGFLVRRVTDFPQWATQVAAYSVGSLAAYWLVQRMAVIVGMA